MPGRKFDTRLEAEELEHKVEEAGGLAGAIAAELDNGTNPKELVDAWRQASTDLMNLVARIRKLAR